MYQPTDPHVWNGRNDALDGSAGYRWHHVVQCVDLSLGNLDTLIDDGKPVAILGFCSDEGVKHNQGRPGAKEGPAVFRKVASNLAWHETESELLIDAGDVICLPDGLEEAQAVLATKVAKLINAECLPIVIGGGHEVAFGNFMGISQASEKKTGIINIDAHFDLRSMTSSPSSGTPFWQISEWCKQHKVPFDYMCIGIQEQANTQILFDRAEALGVKYILADQVHEQSVDRTIIMIDDFMSRCDQIYLTICLDVFDASCAPGVSSPSVNGLWSAQVLPIVRHLAHTGKLISCDIAELNPAFDIDQRTAKLSTKMAYELAKVYWAHSG
ncbi:MAG: formimidoylglutamase [Bacteroidota bacterium]